MLKLGEKQTLIVVKNVEFGVYLAANKEAGEERVLLPAKQVPKGIKTGDFLEVFLYKDSKDRFIATTREPKLTLNQFAVLKVAQVTKIGAFLDWGLEKDLFLPYKEQTARVKQGDEILVRLYIDKSERLCASMKGLYHILSQNPPYRVEDDVQGRVYEFSRNFGAFVAVDDKYSALIPKHEDHSQLHIGEVIHARVTEVKEDGKLTLSLRKKAYLQIEEDANRVLQVIEEFAGVLPFNDKAPAEVIMRDVGLSKNAFKRAVGHLYKERIVEITDKSIRLVK
ncbi:MAG: S1 RNA-binding domain-containing protein [Lachnospiraceae bacterium]|nr:S1 RNA-binding domain-containing protein [Lachnospiraceae bacterium]